MFLIGAGDGVQWWNVSLPCARFWVRSPELCGKKKSHIALTHFFIFIITHFVLKLKEF